MHASRGNCVQKNAAKAAHRDIFVPAIVVYCSCRGGRKEKAGGYSRVGKASRADSADDFPEAPPARGKTHWEPKYCRRRTRSPPAREAPYVCVLDSIRYSPARAGETFAGGFLPANVRACPHTRGRNGAGAWLPKARVALVLCLSRPRGARRRRTVCAQGFPPASYYNCDSEKLDPMPRRQLAQLSRFPASKSRLCRLARREIPRRGPLPARHRAAGTFVDPPPRADTRLSLCSGAGRWETPPAARRRAAGRAA